MKQVDISRVPLYISLFVINLLGAVATFVFSAFIMDISREPVAALNVLKAVRHGNGKVPDHQANPLNYQLGVLRAIFVFTLIIAVILLYDAIVYFIYLTQYENPMCFECCYQIRKQLEKENMQIIEKHSEQHAFFLRDYEGRRFKLKASKAKKQNKKEGAPVRTIQTIRSANPPSMKPKTEK